MTDPTASDTRVWRLTEHYRDIHGDILRTTDEVMALADIIDPATGSADYYIDLAPNRDKITQLNPSPYNLVAELVGHRCGDRVYCMQDYELAYRVPGREYGDGSIDSNDSPVWLLIADLCETQAIERWIEEHTEDEEAIRAALN